MKKLLFSLIALFVCTSAFAQAPAIEWQKSYGGSRSDGASSIALTSDGGYIVAGVSKSTDGDVTGNHGSYDYWIVKINDTGGMQWQKSLGGSSDDEAWSLKQTTGGGYIVSGWSTSNDGEVSGTHSSSDDYWVVKLNDTGGIQWQKALGGNLNELATSIQQTYDGGYIVTGYAGSHDGDVTGNHGSDDYWVVKLNDTGAIQWEKSYGGSNAEEACDIKQTFDGGYIITGRSTSDDGDLTLNHGSYDYWTLKINDTGLIIWQRSLGGADYDEALSIIQVSSEAYVIAGYSSSNDGDVSGNHGGYDFWIVKIDDAGGVIWQKSLGGTGSDAASFIQLTSDNGFIVAGQSSSNDGDVSGNHGGEDVWVVKLNDAGIIQWQKSLGGSGNEGASSIQQIPNGYIIAGASNSTDGDVTGTHGNGDYWVVKLNCGLNAGTITGDTMVCFGSVITLTDTATGGTWAVSNGNAAISGGVVTGVAAGADTAIYTLTNTCGSTTTSFPLTVLPCPSFVNELTAPTISISPNPTAGNISITGAGKGNIKVYDIIGQLIKEANNTDQISIAGFPEGMYVVRLFGGQGEMVWQDKVVKTDN